MPFLCAKTCVSGVALESDQDQSDNSRQRTGRWHESAHGLPSEGHLLALLDRHYRPEMWHTVFAERRHLNRLQGNACSIVPSSCARGRDNTIGNRRNQEAQRKGLCKNRSRLKPTRRRYELEPQLANFCDNERHVVGEGTVTPCSNAVEDRLLHIREW